MKWEDKTTDAEGNVTTFGYGEFGQLEEVHQVVGGEEIPLSLTGYDPTTGLLAAVQDAAGFTQTFGYNDFNEVTSTTYDWVDTGNTKTIVTFTDRDAEGRVEGTRREVDNQPIWNTSTVYTDGFVTSETDRFGVTTETKYDARGNVIETRTRSLDAQNNLTWVVSRTVYDINGRPIYESDPHEEPDPENTQLSAPGTRTTYDTMGRVIKSERIEDLLIEVDLDAFGEPFTFVQDIPSLVSLFETETFYDAAGRVDYTVGATGVAERFVYDLAGRQKAAIRDLDGDFATLGDQDTISESFYDKAGRVIRTKDANGVETFFEYDALGQQTAVIQSNVLDESGDVVHDYLRTETAYDELGRRVLVRENISQANPLEPASIDDLLARDTHYEYNSAGNLEAVILPAADDPDEVNPAILTHPRYEYTYDIYGNLKSIKDNIKQDDPLIATTDSSGARETLFTYDEEHRQLTRTLPIGVSTTGDPNDFVETNVYNSLGQLDYTIDFEGRVTRYVYDALRGLEKKEYFDDILSFDSGNGSPDGFVEYVYDALGRRTETVQDADGDPNTPGDQRITTEQYDSFSRLLRVDAPEGAINYEYNHLGQRTRTYTGAAEQGQPSGPLDGVAITDTHYAYDLLGRLETVTLAERDDAPLPSTEATTYTYDGNDNIETITYPGGMVSRHTYDELNRLVSLEHSRADDSVLSSYDYTLALDGKRLAVDEVDESGQATHVDWVYDELGRLTREIYDAPGTANDFKALYYFDLVGNRLRKAVDADQTPGFEQDTTYDYDANDRLLSEAFANDSVLTKSTSYEYGPGAGLGFGGDWTVLTRQHEVDEIAQETLQDIAHAYNLQGRLGQSVIDKYVTGVVDARETVTNSYDHAGNRVRRLEEIDLGADDIIDSTNETLYVVDSRNPTGHSQILEEKSDTASLPDRSYVIGLDVVSQADSGASSVLLVSDGHGSTRQVVEANAAAVVLESYSYDAYGIANGFAPIVAITTLLYNGEQFDSRLNFQNLRDRFYQVTVGRFNRLDPFAGLTSQPPSLHKYAFTPADPINHNDPSGRFFTQISAAFSAAGQLAARAVNFSRTVATGLYIRAQLGLAAIVAGSVRGWHAIVTQLQGFANFAIQVPSAAWRQVLRLLQRGADVVPSQAQAAQNGYLRPESLRTAWQRVVDFPANTQVHHIVEQGRGVERFGARAINSFANSIPLPQNLHQAITRYSSSSQRLVPFLRAERFREFRLVRDYVSRLNWEQQWRFGNAVVNHILQHGNLTNFDPQALGLL